MGEIKLRGRIYWIRYYRDGKRFEESSGSDKQKVARDLLKVREGDVAKGVPITPKIGRLTFREAVAAVVSDYKVNRRRSTGHVERRIAKHLDPAFGGWRMVAITTPAIRRYIEDRQKAGAAIASINRELAILKRAFKLALQDGRLLGMPHIPMLEESNARQGFFERHQFEAVRERMPKSVQGLVTFAYLTGWRVRSEIMPLTWAQVDMKAGVVRLEPGTTKTGEGRMIHFGPIAELRAVMEDQRRLTDDVQRRQQRIIPQVFHRNGEPVKSFYKSWRAACRAAGCPGRIPHDCRRTAVRNMVRTGVPEQTAMKMTGHLTREIFDRYCITNDADMREGAERYAEGLSGTKRGQSASGSAGSGSA